MKKWSFKSFFLISGMFIIASCGGGGGGGVAGDSTNGDEVGHNGEAREPGKWISSGDWVTIVLDSMTGKEDENGSAHPNFDGMHRMLMLSIETPDNAMLYVNSIPCSANYLYEQNGSTFTCSIATTDSSVGETIELYITQGRVPGSSGTDTAEAFSWEYKSKTGSRSFIKARGSKATLTKAAR